MSTYKPITIKPISYVSKGSTSLPTSAAKYSPSSKVTGGGAQSVSLVPYSSPTKALETSAQKNDVGVVGRTVATFGDLVANILAGAAKSLEGIYDFGATAVGAVGGIFSDEFQEAVRKHVEYDFVGDRIADPLQEMTESSYLNELRVGKYSVGEAVELIAQGVGGMLPSIGLAALTGGGSLAAQIAGTGSMMVGAAGNATEEAMNEGAGYGSAAAYGLARGAVEGATEYLGGITLGGGTSLAGKALAGTTLGKAAQKGAGRVIYNFVSEGAEEALSDLTDPLAKYLTGVDKNVGENYNDTIKGLPQTFLVGGSVGTVLGAGQSFLRSRSKDQQERGGSAATRADFCIRDAVEQAENFDSVDASRVAAAIRNGYEGASYQLMQMEPEKRAKYLDTIGVHKLAFNEDGTLSAKAAENANTEAVSSSLRAISGNLAHAPIAADVQISESAKTAKETVIKAIGKNANVVITDAIEGNNAVYNPDEDVIYISNGALDGSSFNNEDVARAVALHEVAHKAEGTAAYTAMLDEVEKIYSDENAPAEVKAMIGDRVQRRRDLIKQYWDRNNTREQNRYVVDTELVSNMLGDLLGNPYFVERMGARNDGAWKRFILALKAADMGKAAGVTKETQKYLSGLYKAYTKAVDDAGSGFKVSSIVDDEEKEKAAEGVSEANERESKQKPVRYISFKRIGTETVRKLRSRLAELYDGQDGVADGIAIAIGETVYIVDSGCEDGEISFGVRRRKTIANKVARSEFIKETNDDAISKIQVSDGLHERFGGGRSGDSGRSMRRESGAELQADSRKSRNNGRGASEQTARDRGLKDERNSKQAQTKKVIDLSNDDRLSALVEGVHGSRRYNIIREYILAELADQPIRLSDGKMAVVDKRDAQHIARNAGNEKATQISHIKEIVESAMLIAEEESAKENKFSHFWYYEAHALYEGELVSLYVNVGQARNDKSYHIYDITKKIRDTAHRVNDVGRPVGHALKNGISNKSIPQKTEKSTENPKKVSDERKSKKAYRRAEASAALDETVKELFVFTDAYASLKGKSKKEATDILWKALNTAEEGEVRRRAALDVADFVLDNMAMETLEANQNVQKAADTIAALKPYYHKLDLDGIKAEIKKRFGKETSPYLLWGKQNGKATVDLETVFAELSEKEIFLSSTAPAEIFFEIYDMDKKAKGVIEESANTLLRKSISTEEREGLRKKISKDILQAYEEKGAKTIDFNLFHRKLASAEGWAEFWKKRYLNEVDRHRITNRILDKARRLDDIKKGAFMSATQSRVWIEKFKGSIFRLSQIRFLGNLNTVGTRRICARLEAWYTDENNELVKSAPHLYDKEIAVVLKELARNERTHTEAEDAILDGLMTRLKTSDLKKLHELYTAETLGKEYDANVKLLLRELSSESIFDKEELVMLERVVDYFAHFAEKYNLVYRAGEYVKASDLAKAYIKRFTERKRKAPGAFRKWFESYYASYGDPMALARYMDCYDKHGFFTETLEEIRRAGIKAAVREMKIRAPIEKFYKKNPKFLGNLKNKRVKDWNGAEIPLANAISLYMTLGREQAIKGLARKGYVFQTSKDAEKVRLQGFMPMEEVSDDQLAAAAKEARDNLYKQFTEDEKAFIGLVEAAFEECKKAKYDTDMIRHGYSNVIEGYYFPIARAYVSHSIDSFKYQDEMDAVSSKPFNNDTVKNAEGELFINAVDAILNRHVRGVTQYAELSLMVDAFDVLYSLNVNETPGKVESIATESEKVWGESKAYFKKLVRDVQGLRAESKDTLLAKLLPTIRSGYAKYLLGANPKVWVTQLSSLAASTSILDANCIVKGLSINAKDVDEYCALAQLRNTENTAALAQGVLEKVSGFGDVLMKPIGAVDRFVIERLFAACQVQVDKNGAAKLGTKENKVAAGELLERVILETQQNSLATERSAAMRSENEIEKTITMFSADAMKVLGRVLDAFGEAQTIRRLLKLENDKGDNRDSAKIERYQEELKRAGKKLARSVSALLSSALMMALIAQLVRRLLNKKDKDEAVENIVGDVAGNLIGGLPLIRDAADLFMNGYDIDYYAFSAMNDLLGSVSDIVALSRDAMEGERDAKKTAKAIRSAFYSAGMVLGVPTRNIYNYSYAAINIVSPETGYKMDNLFCSKSYRADLAAAVESGDDGMVATIAGLMLDDGVGGMTDKVLRQTMRDLIAAGFDVVPRSVKSSFTYEGEVYELNAKQKKAFEATYKEAHEEAARLVKYRSFTSASDAVKAKAVSFVYDLYYDMALHERVGDGELGKSALFAKAIDVPVLALAVATAKSFESDKDENGKTITGSLKKKIHDHVASLKLDTAQKYMLMGYLGYKNTLGEDKVKAYIQTLKLSEAQKKVLLEASGY